MKNEVVINSDIKIKICLQISALTLNVTQISASGLDSNITHPADRHLVGSQCPRLVRADNGGASQRLHRGQRTDDGVFLGHATGAQRQAGGDNSRQTLRYGCHSQRHGYLEIVDGTSDPRTAVDRVGKVADVNDPHGNADERDDFRELLAELVQLLLQRGLFLLRGCHLVADLTDFRGYGSGDDHADGATRCDVCTLWEKEHP